MHNLAKRYLAAFIKEECWNSMAVKGRALKVIPGTTPQPMGIFIESLMAEKLFKNILKKIYTQKSI